MRYALHGITQAQELKDREAEARLLFCIGENNWRLSLKNEAYKYFDRTIELLRGSKDMREMMLLSSYYGAEMGFLMTDSRIKEALALAYEREKLLKKLEKLRGTCKNLCFRLLFFAIKNLCSTFVLQSYSNVRESISKAIKLHTPFGVQRIF